MVSCGTRLCKPWCSARPLQLTALEPFGASIAGLEIASAGARLASALRSLIARHRVIVLRDQDATAAHFAAFLQKLGPLSFTEGEMPVKEAPQLNLVTNVGRLEPPRSVFHTDTSYVARPPAYTALKIIEVPQSGGETLFTDQVCALAALSTGERRDLAKRTICHAWTPLGGDEIGTDHPAVLVHPLTGEHSLYLSTPERCVRLSGYAKTEGCERIDDLYCHSINNQWIYRHAWQIGDIVIWDNRLTMHRADHSAVVGCRVLHRGIVMPQVNEPMQSA